VTSFATDPSLVVMAVSLSAALAEAAAGGGSNRAIKRQQWIIARAYWDSRGNAGHPGRTGRNVDAIECVQACANRVAESLGSHGQRGVGFAVRFLKSKGATGDQLGRRLQRLSKSRNMPAHPEDTLLSEVEKFLSGLPVDGPEAFRSGSSSGTRDSTAASDSERDLVQPQEIDMSNMLQDKVDELQTVLRQVTEDLDKAQHRVKVLEDEVRHSETELAALAAALAASESATARARGERGRFATELEGIQDKLSGTQRVVATAASRVRDVLRSYCAKGKDVESEFENWDDNGEVLDLGFDILDGVSSARQLGRRRSR